MATIVEGDPKAPFSIATTPRCRGGRYSYIYMLSGVSQLSSVFPSVIQTFQKCLLKYKNPASNKAKTNRPTISSRDDLTVVKFGFRVIAFLPLTKSALTVSYNTTGICKFFIIYIYIYIYIYMYIYVCEIWSKKSLLLYVPINRCQWLRIELRTWICDNRRIMNKYMTGGARGVMVIGVGNGHGDTSSNPGRNWLHFT